MHLTSDPTEAPGSSEAVGTELPQGEASTSAITMGLPLSAWLKHVSLELQEQPQPPQSPATSTAAAAAAAAAAACSATRTTTPASSTTALFYTSRESSTAYVTFSVTACGVRCEDEKVDEEMEERVWHQAATVKRKGFRGPLQMATSLPPPPFREKRTETRQGSESLRTKGAACRYNTGCGSTLMHPNKGNSKSEISPKHSTEAEEASCHSGEASDEGTSAGHFQS
ncbi:hypothetical protein O3P69_005754 [Scylla paramamosain]|uniref:Uncharacterized protein n=1 Tax=Scylla paramamosain TaxID=85552 RepID=A0AAW0U8L7_SCYPA